jgi:hypothetical protein
MIAIGTFVEKRIQEIEDVAVVTIEFLLLRFILLEGSYPIGMISVAGYFL